MKTRTGFVSNSSSSSFIIEEKYIKDIEQMEFKEDLAKESADEQVKDDYDWWKDYPKYRQDNELEEYDYKGRWQDVYDAHKKDYKTLLNIRNDAEVKNIYSISEEYRYPEEFLKYPRSKCKKLTFTDYFNRYEIYQLGDFTKHLSHRLYYLIKPCLDNPKKRLEIYREITRKDVSTDLIYRYKGNRRVTKNYIYKRDVDEVKKYKKEIMNLSSKEFYNKIVLGEIRSFVNRDWNTYLNRHSKGNEFLDTYFAEVDKELIKIGNKLVDDFIEENKDKTFYEVEYEDGGGCGIYAPLLEQGLYLDDIPHKKINKH